VLACLAVLSLSALCAPLARAGVPAAYLAEDRALVSSYAAQEGARLGLAVPGGIENFITVEQSPRTMLQVSGRRDLLSSAYAETSCDFDGEAFAGCTIDVAPAPHMKGLMGPVIAHEVFHVYEAYMAGSRANYEREHEWRLEGAAVWVQAQFFPGDKIAREWQAEYLEHPGRPLFSRTYDAVGFFTHMQSVGLSPWSRVKSIFAAGSNTAAYGAAIGGSQSFLESEASVFFRDKSFGWPWDERPSSPPAPGAVHFKPPKVTITGTGHTPLAVAPYTDAAVVLSLTGMSKSRHVLEIDVPVGVRRDCAPRPQAG
jgi:hypothetical protein